MLQNGKIVLCNYYVFWGVKSCYYVIREIEYKLFRMINFLNLEVRFQGKNVWLFLF